MTQGKILTNEQINEIIKMYNEGISSTKIAKHFNCKTNTVTARLKAAGITIRGPGKVTEEQVQEIIKLYGENSSCKMIGDKLGLNDVSVLRILKKNNVQIRDKHDWHQFKTRVKNYK